MIVADANAELLLGEFSRYQRDYDIRSVRSAVEVADAAHEITATGGWLAMVVIDSSLFSPTDLTDPDPDQGLLARLHQWRQIVPTARVLVVAPFQRFLDDSERLRPVRPRGSSTHCC